MRSATTLKCIGGSPSGRSPRQTSCRHHRMLAQHRGDLPPAVDPAQLDLTTHHEAEEVGVRPFCPREFCYHSPQYQADLRAPRLSVNPFLLALLYRPEYLEVRPDCYF